MPQPIAVIQGHPDPDQSRFRRALADAHAEGAPKAGYQIRRIEVAEPAFPFYAR